MAWAAASISHRAARFCHYRMPRETGKIALLDECCNLLSGGSGVGVELNTGY